jgi:hypothetical protein
MQTKATEHGREGKTVQPGELPLNAGFAGRGEAIHARVGDVHAGKLDAGRVGGARDRGEDGFLSLLAQRRDGDPRPDPRRSRIGARGGRRPARRLDERERAFETAGQRWHEQQWVRRQQVLKSQCFRRGEETAEFRGRVGTEGCGHLGGGDAFLRLAGDLLVQPRGEKEREALVEQRLGHRLAWSRIVERLRLVEPRLPGELPGEPMGGARRSGRAGGIGEHEEHHPRLGFARQRTDHPELRRAIGDRQQVEHVGRHLRGEIEPGEPGQSEHGDRAENSGGQELAATEIHALPDDQDTPRV